MKKELRDEARIKKAEAKKKADLAKKLQIGAIIAIPCILIIAIIAVAFFTKDAYSLNIDYDAGLDGEGRIVNIKVADYVNVCDYANMVIPKAEVEMTEEELNEHVDSILSANDIEELTDEFIAEKYSENASTVDEYLEYVKTSTMEETAEDTESLKAEISKLREEIRRKESEQIKMAQEIADFNRLFPNVPISGLPEDVINNMNKGIPLTAAYALYEKEAALLANKAHEVNTRNASLSAGRAGTETKGEFFTPDEVRTMSQKEVHENYKKIRNSMTQWRKAY